MSVGHFRLKFVPEATRNDVMGWLGESLKVKVSALPDTGMPNEASAAQPTDRHGLNPSSVVVVSGNVPPLKVGAIADIDAEAVRQAFLRRHKAMAFDLVCSLHEMRNCGRRP